MTILNNSISRCNEPATGAWRAKDATVVPGQGPRLVVCSREGLGQQLLHVEGTLTAISRTEANRIKLCHPQITCILLSWRRYNVFCLLSVSSCVVYLKITAWSGRNDVFFYSLYWCDCRVMLVPCYIWTPNVPENFTWVNCWSRMSSDRFSDLHADIIVEKKKSAHTHTHIHRACTDFHKADKFRQLFKMGTTTHASTLRSVSYTGHTEAAGVITLIRVAHSPREDACARPRTPDTRGDSPWNWPGQRVS